MDNRSSVPGVPAFSLILVQPHCGAHLKFWHLLGACTGQEVAGRVA